MNPIFIPPYNLSEIPDFQSLINGTISESNLLKRTNIECKTSNQKYSVIRYLKEYLTADMSSTYGLCRSVIVNSLGNVVAFAPPKSIPSNVFIQKYPDPNDDLIAEEFVDGTMINVFWDPTIGISGGWEISTRNTVGAMCSFFKETNQKTFRDMFLEASSKEKLTFDQLSRDFCYSFVLQHPSNRIVVPFHTPALYLVAMYSIRVINNTIYCHPIQPSVFKNFDWGESTIRFPQMYSWSTYTQLTETYASMNTPYHIVGVVVYNNTTGERMKIRNPVYEQVRNLRGNQPKLQYQYLCLRKEGKVSDFLKFYPENKKDFSKFRDNIHTFTNTLYTNYISCYIKKEKPLMDFSEQYRTHMFNLHKIYMEDLREKKLFVNNTVVIKYVNSLHSSLLMYSLNFSLRKRHVDVISADANI
jgi:hypothetical protein